MSAALIKGPEFEVLAGDLLGRGHHLRFQAEGASMAPFIQAGDRLEVAPWPPERVRRGMVLLARLGDGRLVAHRVLRCRRDQSGLVFLLRGDANPCPDGWLGAAELLGRVIAVERAGLRRGLTGRNQRLLAWLWLLPGARWIYFKSRAVWSRLGGL
ncbi:MAG: S24/S26 family peptidase [Anaerolineales bacterium]|nr:S24/S26 family peptidase [Anaerolineales bacterium]